MKANQSAKEAEKKLTDQSEQNILGKDRCSDKLIHELKVHQVELEMLSETLDEFSCDVYHDRFVNLYDFAPVGYLTLNGDNQIFEANLTAAAMLGIERNQLILDSLCEWIADESWDIWLNHFQYFKRHSGKHSCELLMRRNNGSTFHARVDGYWLTSIRQKPSLRIALIDIDDRKLGERRLQESQRRYAGIVETAMDGIITVDAEQRILLFNAAAEKMFGCTADDALGSLLKRFIPERFRRAHDRHFSGFSAGAVDHRRVRGMVAVTGLRANGEEFPVEVSISMLEDAGDKTFTAILRDVSERKQVEARLHDSQKENQFLADLIRASDQPMGVGYLDGRVKFVNAAFEELTGYTAEELMRINWSSDLTPPEWFDIERDKLSELLDTGLSIRYEKEYSRKDRTRVPVEVLAHLKTDAEGKPQFYYAFVTDISERKRAEQTIRDSEERMLLATEATGVGIWEWNVITNTLRWDSQMFRIYGMTPSEDGFIPFTNWRESILQEDLPRQDKGMGDTISGLKHNTCEFRIRRASDGKYRHIQEVETVRTNAQGRVEWLVGTNLDITERNVAEITLRQTEERWRFALQAANLGAWDLNFTNNTFWRSTGYSQIFGYEDMLPEWSYEIFLQHVLEEDRQEVDRYVQYAKTQYQDWNFECRIRRTDGDVRWISVQAKYHTEEGRCFDHVFGLIEDITERKQNEQAMKDANRRMDEFLAMLAHELRNPLAPIGNAVEVMKLAKSDPSRISWGADIIERQVKHLTRLVDDLLDISRIKRGLIELKKESVEVKDFIRSALETCQPLLDARKQSFTLSLPDEALWVEGDRIRLAQVVSNLVNNAAKYSEEGSHIRLSVELCGNRICIHVADEGCGIEPEDLLNLFELFYQAERNLDRSQGGLGIGLSLVQSLVEQHGGDVQVFSAGHGQGSEFVVRLPRFISSESAMVCQETFSVSSPKKMNILVVEDNTDVAESLALLLEIDGHTVRIVDNGTAALEIVDDMVPDAILLDIGLPGMNGYEVAKTLRCRNAWADTLFIAMTGYGKPEDRQKSQACGFDAHLVKPPDLEMLRKLLNERQIRGDHFSS